MIQIKNIYCIPQTLSVEYESPEQHVLICLHVILTLLLLVTNNTSITIAQSLLKILKGLALLANEHKQTTILLSISYSSAQISLRKNNRRSCFCVRRLCRSPG